MQIVIAIKIIQIVMVIVHKVKVLIQEIQVKKMNKKIIIVITTIIITIIMPIHKIIILSYQK